MLVFVMKDGDDAAMMTKRTAPLEQTTASFMTSTNVFLLASPTSGGAHRVHWSGIWDHLTSRIDAEKDWGTLRTERL